MSKHTVVLVLLLTHLSAWKCIIRVHLRYVRSVLQEYTPDTLLLALGIKADENKKNDLVPIPPNTFPTRVN